MKTKSKIKTFRVTRYVIEEYYTDAFTAKEAKDIILKQGGPSTVTITKEIATQIPF